eukprot:jgi/Botrbrau1/16154/Bobra.0309s0004.1
MHVPPVSAASTPQTVTAALSESIAMLDCTCRLFAANPRPKQLTKTRLEHIGKFICTCRLFAPCPRRYLLLKPRLMALPCLSGCATCLHRIQAPICLPRPD